MANKKIKEVAVVTKEQVTKAVSPESSRSLKQRIYVGPNVLGLPKYTVIESDFTVHINGFIEKCPEIKKMFVPIDEMTKTENRSKEKGTLEHRYYRKITEFKNESQGEN